MSRGPSVLALSAPRFRSSQFLSSSVPQFLSSSVPQFLSSSVPQFLSSSVPQFLSSSVPIIQAEGKACCSS
ncbi:MAG: hypothetical protein EOS37_30320 [Mesorhizobium sp.]|nr:MAG: hypothetical protein EOS37_30320 [Mesorhizobium sp.]